jgi:hypothetical protein
MQTYQSGNAAAKNKGGMLKQAYQTMKTVQHDFLRIFSQQ